MFHIKDSNIVNKVPHMASSDPDSLEWIALLGQIKKYMHNGPDAPRIQNIIRRMDEKRLEDFEGEEAFLDELWEVRKSPEQSEKFNLYPLDQELLEFMEQAYNYYLHNTDQSQ